MVLPVRLQQFQPFEVRASIFLRYHNAGCRHVKNSNVPRPESAERTSRVVRVPVGEFFKCWIALFEAQVRSEMHWFRALHTHFYTMTAQHTSTKNRISHLDHASSAHEDNAGSLAPLISLASHALAQASIACSSRRAFRRYARLRMVCSSRLMRAPEQSMSRGTQTVS
jgi:hypothetical protein